MKYLDDKRKGLTGQQTLQQPRTQTLQTVQKQTVSAPQKTAAPAAQPAQTQAAPKVMEQHSSAPAQTQTQAPAQTAPSAADQAQQLLSQQPGAYQSKWGSSIDDVLAQLMNPQEFSYDPNTDPLYLMLRDQAAQNGRLAMEDTMGQAAQLTGGYGNSHAQMLGQQAYSGYLDNVNAMIPDLKQAARDEYDAQNDALLQKLSLMMDQENQDYGRYLDEIERQRYESELAYSREQDALANERYDREWAYQQEQDSYSRQQDAYDRLLEMIVSTGYQPTAEELAAAGMTEAQAKAWRSYYEGTYGSGGSSSGGGGGDRTSDRKPGDGSDDEKPAEQPTEQNPGRDVQTREELGDPFKKDDYVTVSANCAVFAGNGASASEISAYLKEALNEGSISQEQYKTLMAKYGNLADSGNNGNSGGNSGSSGGGRGSGHNNRYNTFN